MAGWHKHANMMCVECGVIVYPMATCIMSSGPAGCRLRETITCKDCYGSQSVPDPGKSPRYKNIEVGILTAQEHASRVAEPVDPGNVRYISSLDVSYRTESMVQKQSNQDGRSHSVGPKSAFTEPLRQNVPQEEGLPSKSQGLQ